MRVIGIQARQSIFEGSNFLAEVIMSVRNLDWEGLKAMPREELELLCAERRISVPFLKDEDDFLKEISRALGVKKPASLAWAEIRDAGPDALRSIAARHGIALRIGHVDRMRYEIAEALDLPIDEDEDFDLFGKHRAGDRHGEADEERENGEGCVLAKSDKALCRQVMRKIDAISGRQYSFALLFSQEVMDLMFGKPATPALIRMLAEVAYKFDFAMSVLDRGYAFAWVWGLSERPYVNKSVLDEI